MTQKGLHALHFVFVLVLSYFAFVGMDHILYEHYMAKAVQEVQ